MGELAEVQSEETQKTQVDTETTERVISEKRIGERIKRLRLKKSMGLVELGKHTGLSASFLSQLETGRVAGFYTLSSSNVPLTAVPEPLASRLPRYPTVPAALIGWLGRDQSYAGVGLGEALLFDAIKTVAQAPLGIHAIFADAIDGKAAAFYASFGFIALNDRPNTLYLPVATALDLLSGVPT